MCLLLGMAGGLARIGWNVGPLPPGAVVHHGPLMLAGFLGTLIGLERAVSSHRRWAYAAPILTGVSGIALIADPDGLLARVGIALGSVAFTVVLLVGFPSLRAPWVAVQLVGAASFALGSALFAKQGVVASALPWWTTFLVLTIAGERLELSRILEPPRWALRLLAGIVGVLAVGVVISALHPASAARVVAIAWLGIVLWFARFDLARRSLRREGLPRFMAVALLSGYVWLAISGVLALGFGAPQVGLEYDAILHTLFLGFVFAMIFGHAPAIFPAILGIPIRFRKRFYLHLGLLHLGLAVRVVGDLAAWSEARRWGGLLNALAILLFLINTASSLERRR